MSNLEVIVQVQLPALHSHNLESSGWTTAGFPRFTLGQSAETEIFLPHPHCLSPHFFSLLSHPFLSFLTTLSLDFCPTLTFKFWQICPSICVSLQFYRGYLTVDLNKALLGERLPFSTNCVVSRAAFCGHLENIHIPAQIG
jgi:hypothetical protein